METSGISNSIPDNDLENAVISISRDPGVEMDLNDIKGCHRLPLSRSSRGQDKRVTVKFVNRKHSEALLRENNGIVVRALIIWMFPITFLSRYPFAHITDIYGVSARICKGKARKIMIFCLGGVVCIKLSENGGPIKLYHMNNIPDFPTESSVENQIVNMVIFLCILWNHSSFCCDAIL